jgi:hypothetical protein
MNIFALAMMIMIGSMSWGYAATFEIVPTPTEQATVDFWAARRALPAQTIMEEICATGNARYTQQRVELEAREAQQAFNAASPEDKAALCAILASYGFTCTP